MNNKEKAPKSPDSGSSSAWDDLDKKTRKNLAKEKMTGKDYDELIDALKVLRDNHNKLGADDLRALYNKMFGLGGDDEHVPTLSADEYDELKNAFEVVQKDEEKFGEKIVAKIGGIDDGQPDNTAPAKPKTVVIGQVQSHTFPTQTNVPPVPPTPPVPTKPAGDLPLPNVSGDIDHSVPLPDFDALTVGVVNQDADLKAKARYVGESRLAEDLNTGGFFRKVAKRVWKGGIAKNYYRQKYINEASRDMRQAQNIVLDFDEKERRRFNNDVCRSFLSNEEGVIDEQAGDVRKSLLAENPELHREIQSIVAKYASGDIKTPEEASREFKSAIRKLGEGEYFGGDKHLAISNITEVAIEAKKRYDGLMTIAEAMNGRLEHDEAIARVMAGFDVKYGQRRLDRLDPRYNKVDKIVDKIQNSKVGMLVSPETVALATGAAACVVDMVGKRVPSIMFAAIPGLSGAIVSGVRASSDFEKERSRALYDVRYNRKFEGGQKRREQMMATMHEHHDANEVSDGLAARIQAIRQAQESGGDIAGLQNELVREVARCKTFLSYDKTERSVLSYTSEVDAPSEQLRLLQTLGNAKALLRETGVADLDNRLNEQSELMTSMTDLVESDLKESEKAKRKAKVKRIATRAGVSLALGAAAGVATQEVRALFDPNTQGIFEHGAGDYGTRLTAGKKLALMITGKDKQLPDTKANFLIDGQNVVDNSKAIDFVKAKDGTYSMVGGDGKTIASGLDWNSKTGELTPESIKILKDQGIDVTRAGSLKQSMERIVEDVQTRKVSFSEYVKNSGENVPTVRRVWWYDNNTTAFDQNELRCYYHTDTDGNHGLITGMFDNGSFHGDKTATFSSLARDGHIKLMISPTSETQGTPIEVIGKLTSNGQLEFCPEPNSAAAQFFNEDGIFIGRYAEVVQDLGVDADGATMIAPLATLSGQGLEGVYSIEETIQKTVTDSFTVPEYGFSFPSHEWDFPMILPFSPDGAMNASRRNDPTRRIVNPGDVRGYGYGYGYGEGYENGLGEVSPRIEEGKKLNLGTEVSWYVDDQLKNKSKPDYYNEVKKQAESSDVLKNLDNNIKTIVTIPVHGPSETDNIYNTLSLYAQQKDVDPKSFVVVVDLNWRDPSLEKMSQAELDAKVQATRQQIEKAQKDFSNIKIVKIEQTGHKGIGKVAREMNDVVMYSINSAIKSGRMAADNDVLIVRNDADIKHMNDTYIASYQKAMQENGKTPVFTGTSWFDIDRQKEAPVFGATEIIERIINIWDSTNYSSHTAGGNFAYRASHFAAINGFGFEADGVYESEAAGSDDTNVGIRMENAFRNVYATRGDNSTEVNNTDLMDPMTQMFVRVGGAVMDLDADRQLSIYNAGRSGQINPETGRRYLTSDAYGANPMGYNNNPIRPIVGKFIEDMTDRQSFNDSAEQFEREISRYFSWSGNPRSMYCRNILKWLFNTDDAGLDSICKTELNTSGTGERVEFRFIGDGKERFREMIVSRFGDGFTPEVRNTLQEAIANNKWVSPTVAPTP